MRKTSKTIVYVDGFNLYYGALKKSNLKWLNLSKLGSLVLPNNDIIKIKYFTALVSATSENPNAPVCQMTYLRALKTLPNVEIHYGHYLTQHKFRRLSYFPDLSIKVAIPEEKGSDVNLAAHLLHDAHNNEFETAVVISNDSDLAEPIRLICAGFNGEKQVGILNPHENVCKKLQKVASFYRPLRQGPIQGSQFSVELEDGDGHFRKPEEWDGVRAKTPPKKVPFVVPIELEDVPRLDAWAKSQGYMSHNHWLKVTVKEAINEAKANERSANPISS